MPLILKLCPIKVITIKKGKNYNPVVLDKAIVSLLQQRFTSFYFRCDINDSLNKS